MSEVIVAFWTEQEIQEEMAEYVAGESKRRRR